MNINVIFPFFFLTLLALGNALWGSTVGIGIFINQYYGLSYDSVKSSMVNGVFYILYVLAMPCCIIVKLLPASIIALTLMLAGTILRLFYQIPTPNESFIQGIDAVIAGNILIAIAEPFVFNFIISVSETFVKPKYRGLFIGATSMFTSLGYSVGYLISIYTIGSKDEYKEYFRNINIGYLILASILLIILIYIAINYSSRPTVADELEQVSIDDFVSGGVAVTQCNVMKKNRKLTIWICILVYAIQTGIVNGVLNHLESILIHNGFSEDKIFILSFINLVPGIPMPIILGYIMDKNRSYFKISTMVLIASTLSQILFFYSGTSYIVAFIALLLNGLAYPCISSVFLTLVSEVYRSIRINGQNEIYNNVAFTLSTLFTILIIIVPIPDSEYPILFHSCTFAIIVSCVLYFSKELFTKNKIILSLK